MASPPRSILLVQLPVPPPGPMPIHANIPLAAGYLKLWARRRGLDGDFDIRILPSHLANELGDQGLVEALREQRPWMVGFTCCVWNVERTLWIAQRLKAADPEILIVIGGPEVTADNAWVLQHPAVDYAVIGEGEQTFADLLASHRRLDDLMHGGPAVRDANAFPILSEIPGLRRKHQTGPIIPRPPLGALDELSSPYTEGILDAGEERVMFLETIRGCSFRCKFCYYPKSYDALYYLSKERIVANLKHAAERGVREIVLLDPTLNQRRDFPRFLRLLAQHNPDRQFTFFGELRAEGVDAEIAKLLREANFTEIEVGLQSIDPRTQSLMGRPVNLEAFERGTAAMLDAGLDVRVDLILGLPGDTVDSVRRGIEYLSRSKRYSTVQLFNLSILPGTAFREEATSHQLRYQPRPPYYVLSTPTISTEMMYELMAEAQEAFGLEYDPFPPPVLQPAEDRPGLARSACIDLTRHPYLLPPAERRAQAFTLRLRSDDFDRDRTAAADRIRRIMTDNPHTTLQVLLEPTGDPRALSDRTLESLLSVCFASTSYLDLFYGMHPNCLLGAKRLVVVLPAAEPSQVDAAWIERCEEYATIARHDAPPPTAETA